MNNVYKTLKTRIRTAVLLAAAASLSPAATAQEFSDWTTPENLGSVINSAGFDGAPFITKEGRYLFMASNRATGSGPLDIYVSHRQTRDHPWQDPLSLGASINTPEYNEALPYLSDNGQYLLFVSDRPGGCGNYDIYVSRRLGRGRLLDPGPGSPYAAWSEPQNLGCDVNSPGPEFSPSLFKDEDGNVFLYFSSGLRPGGMGFGDIWVSEFQDDGDFGPATPVVELNTSANDIRPFIEPRYGLEFFFDSNRPGSVNNSPDLYLSTRLCALCQWTTPVNLGAVVNSSAIDGGPKLSSDRSELYFMSNRTGGFGDQDIWVTRRYRVLTSEDLIYDHEATK